MYRARSETQQGDHRRSRRSHQRSLAPTTMSAPTATACPHNARRRTSESRPRPWRTATRGGASGGSTNTARAFRHGLFTVARCGERGGKGFTSGFLWMRPNMSGSGCTATRTRAKMLVSGSGSMLILVQYHGSIIDCSTVPCIHSRHHASHATGKLLLSRETQRFLFQALAAARAQHFQIVYLRGMKREEWVAPIPGRPCLTGLLSHLSATSPSRCRRGELTRRWRTQPGSGQPSRA